MDSIREDLPICVACGTQFDSDTLQPPNRCKICDDPRQFVPPAGQQWTTLKAMKSSDNPQGARYRNKFTQDEVDASIWSICTEPKFAIGQRCILLQTEAGNVLWDLITLLDEETIDWIKQRGGLKAIVISHPHYYTTYTNWARIFECPVYIADDDKAWLCQQPHEKDDLVLFTDVTKEIGRSVTAIKIGGHFDGSLVLHWKKKIFIADSLITVPSAYTPFPRPPGQTTYSFMWSIPNMICLHPDAIHTIWKRIKPFEFDTSHGAFTSMNVRDGRLKARLLESAKIAVKAIGWGDHPLLKEEGADVPQKLELF